MKLKGAVEKDVVDAKSNGQGSRRLSIFSPTFLWTLRVVLVRSFQSILGRMLAFVGTWQKKRFIVGTQEFYSADGKRGYDYLRPLPLGISALTNSLVTDICNSSAFRRLNSIQFLGGIDYVLVRSPNGATRNVRYTRYQHSLGVGRLALHYAQQVGLDDAEAARIFVAALLHDIGHAPLSHSLESVFAEVFGLSHHQATEDIICGRVALGRELSLTLQAYSIDIERVCALISGEDAGHNGFFSGPINFDTIEGISRSRMYGRTNTNTSNPSEIVEAATKRKTANDRDVVDAFWHQKNEAYKYIIGSRLGVLADFACKHFMRENLTKFTRDDYFITEESLFRKLPGLNQLLKSRTFELDVWKLAAEPIPYIGRRFFVDDGSDFFARDDVGRYKQFREPRELEPRHFGKELIATTRDLFDDHGISEHGSLL